MALPLIGASSFVLDGVLVGAGWTRGLLVTMAAAALVFQGADAGRAAGPPRAVAGLCPVPGRAPGRKGSGWPDRPACPPAMPFALVSFALTFDRYPAAIMPALPPISRRRRPSRSCWPPLARAGRCDSQSDRDAKLEARIAAAEAKAAAAEKRANAAEAAAAHSSPVTVDPGPDDPDAGQNDNPDAQPPLEGDFSQQDNGDQPAPTCNPTAPDNRRWPSSPRPRP
jgi:hypothetical protein